MKLERLIGFYTSTALIIVNVLVLFAVLNLMAYLLLSLYEAFAKADPVTNKYGKSGLELVYPSLNESERTRLLQETWSRPYVYEPFTQFKERAYEGKYVNVSADGFRHGNNQASWPPPKNEINVFLLGGSTTFGYGVEDSETIGSHLQDRLRKLTNKRVNVYNFGRGFYYSTQERILFEMLLSAGLVPNYVVFIDGLNDFYHYDGNPLYTDRLRKFVGGEVSKTPRYAKLPLLKLYNTVVNNNGSDSDAKTEHAGGIRYDDPAVLRGVIDRYFNNKRMVESVSAAYGVEPVFVWQPVPTYNYDVGYHLFAGSDFGRHSFSKYGYPLMREYVIKHPQRKNFLWAADIQNGINRPLYVDQVHYTADFSGRLADYIAEHMVENYFQRVP